MLLAGRVGALVPPVGLWSLLALVAFASLGNPTFPGFAGNSGKFGSELFFTSRSSTPLLLSLAMFVLWFFGTMAIFVFLSQRTAKVFAQFLPLRAYTLDILGSCAGMLTFMAMSWFQVPAWFWMLLLIPLFVLSGGTQWAKPAVARAPVLTLAVCAALSYANDLKMFARSDVRNVAVRWSPYQKVKYVSRSRDAGESLRDADRRLAFPVSKGTDHPRCVSRRDGRGDVAPHRLHAVGISWVRDSVAFSSTRASPPGTARSRSSWSSASGLAVKQPAS